MVLTPCVADIIARYGILSIYTVNNRRMGNKLQGTDFDIIGDIHGHADALERLLQKLGYHRKFGVYSHPYKRKEVFVGDFIDRGPKIRETLHLARDMIDSGNALSVMGNHEFNAISFHTPHTEKGGLLVACRLTGERGKLMRAFVV